MSLITSILTGGINNHETTAEEANALATDFISEGIVGAIANTSGVAPATGGFAVNATGTPDTNIQISAGTAYVTATPSTQGSQTIRVKNSATITQAISANSSGSTKYDWVYLSVDATNANAPNTAGDNVASITVSRSSSAASDDGTPPTYAILLAVVTVANGFSTITNSVIRDSRTRCTVGATSESPETYWVTGGLPAVSSVTENGNRSADITFASTVASILTPGMRLRTSRTVAAPTGAVLLNGTTQYLSKASPAGTTFTDDFCAGAWVRLTSYQRGAFISRYNGTSGWEFGVEATGQVFLTGYNAAAGNYSQVISYQSLPLNKWVYVSAQLDMSAFTATTTTSYVMFDGLDVPASVARAGTNPTALVQAGNLEIGSRNGGLQLLPGNIAQAWYSSAKITQATIRTFKNQTMTGSETSIVSAFKLDQASGLNDLNANANNLTATGSPTYSTASPFTTDANGTPGGTYDYAIVTKVSTTTATVQYPEGCAIPTSGGISTVDYSGVASPFGMPVSTSRWRVSSILRTDSTTTSNATYGAFQSGGWKLSGILGDFNVGWQATIYNQTATEMNMAISSTALTGLTQSQGNAVTRYATAISSPAAATVSSHVHIENPESLSTSTDFVFYTLGATTSAGVLGARGFAEIYAVPSNL